MLLRSHLWCQRLQCPRHQPPQPPIVIPCPGGPATNNAAFTVLPTTMSVGSGDMGVLNYAYALEQLEAAFYTQVRTGSYYTSTSTTEK